MRTERRRVRYADRGYTSTLQANSHRVAMEIIEVCFEVVA